MNVKNLRLKLYLIYIYISNRYAYHAIRRVLNEKVTYLDLDALLNIYSAVSRIKSNKLDGIIIEAGCALGGSAIVIATVKEMKRPMEIYDTFTIIPAPSDNDDIDSFIRYQSIVNGKSRGINGNTYYGYEKDLYKIVENTFIQFGIPLKENNILLVKGLYENTLSINRDVALAHIDCDWHDSVMVCLKNIEPHLVKGGVLIIDDYYVWSGCKKAVDGYFIDKKNEYIFQYRSRLTIIKR